MTLCPIWWGSHGCRFEAGHAGSHECDCCDCPDHAANGGRRVDDDGEEWLCAAAPPYYGPGTRLHAP